MVSDDRARGAVGARAQPLAAHTNRTLTTLRESHSRPPVLSGPVIRRHGPSARVEEWSSTRRPAPPMRPAEGKSLPPAASTMLTRKLCTTRRARTGGWGRDGSGEPRVQSGQERRRCQRSVPDGRAPGVMDQRATANVTSRALAAIQPPLLPTVSRKRQLARCCGLDRDVPSAREP